MVKGIEDMHYYSFKIAIRIFRGEAITIMLNCATYNISFCLC